MKDFTILTKIQVYPLDESNEATKKLIEKAKEISLKAYVPYSRYHVGAALELDNGEIICGNNQENAAYPAGICAERTALSYANANFPNQPVKAIAIIAHHCGSYVDEVCTPCGICRQYLLEVEARYKQPIRIVMCSKDMIYEVESAQDLLPLSFGSDNLK